MRLKNLIGLAAAAAGGAASASINISTYDDLDEGFLGSSFSYNGVNYHTMNGVGGVFPSGDTFVPADMGTQYIIENATNAFIDFPEYGSSPNVLTFGSAFIPGPNLTVGPLVRTTMDLDFIADSVGVELIFYENGPWGGIQIHLEAYLGAALVGSDSLTIAGGDDLEGRDNPTTDALSFAGADFDRIYMYSTFGGQFSAPRVLLDNLTFHVVPAPGSACAFAALALAGVRRRRSDV